MMTTIVIPAKAGIQTDSTQVTIAFWFPAFAGMTVTAGMTEQE